MNHDLKIQSLANSVRREAEERSRAATNLFIRARNGSPLTTEEMRTVARGEKAARTLREAAALIESVQP